MCRQSGKFAIKSYQLQIIFSVPDNEDDPREISTPIPQPSRGAYADFVSIQANIVNGSGEGISTTCPQGTVEGLTYSNDANPAFRSTGDFAGPCGQTYNNLPN